MPGWADSGEASKALSGSRWMREVSEGQLSPTVAVNLGTEWMQRGGEGKWERGVRTREVGEGPDNSIEERRVYGDVT